MRRHRNLSTSIGRDQRLRRLAAHRNADSGAFALALSLYTIGMAAADDWGRLPGDPWELLVELMPAAVGAIDEEAVETACDLLAEVGLWQVYRVDGRRLIAFPAGEWFEGQRYIGRARRFDDRRSRYPAPPDWPAWLATAEGSKSRAAQAGQDAPDRPNLGESAQLGSKRPTRAETPKLAESSSCSIVALPPPGRVGTSSRVGSSTPPEGSGEESPL